MILGSGGDRHMASPGLPVDRRQDARQIAEDELHVEDALQPLIAIRGQQMVLEVGLDPPEDELVAVGVAPAKIPIDHVAGEIVREQPVRTGLDEGEVAEPVEQLAHIGSVERRPQQGFGGDPGQGAGLQRLPLLEVGHRAEEPLNQGRHQVGRVDGQVDAAVPDDLVGQQRQAERMAVAGLQQTPVHGLGHAAAAKVLPTFLRGQVAQAMTRSSSRHAGSARQPAPGGCRPASTVTTLAGRSGNSCSRIQSSRAASLS